MRDLPRIVADTPVGKDVEVVIVRKGKEQTVTVKLGRLEDGAKPKPASVTTGPGADESPEKPVVQKTLGLSISGITEALRKEYNLRESVRGVVVTGVEPGSAADKRLKPGNVIVTIEQQQVTTPEQMHERVEQLKTGGKKTALLLVSDGAGRRAVRGAEPGVGRGAPRRSRAGGHARARPAHPCAMETS